MIELGVAFLTGLALGIIVWGTVKKSLDTETKELIGELERNAVKLRERNAALTIEVRETMEAIHDEFESVTDELNRARWSLNGRVRGPDDAPIYVMPPGQPNAGRCDDARLAWMDATHEAAKALRAAGLNQTADKVYPDTQPANQYGAKA